MYIVINKDNTDDVEVKLREYQEKITKSLIGIKWNLKIMTHLNMELHIDINVNFRNFTIKYISHFLDSLYF